MDEAKYKEILKTEKFEAICFTLDFIETLTEAQGFINKSDHAHALATFYDKAFNNGKRDVLDRTIGTCFYELDEIEDD